MHLIYYSTRQEASHGLEVHQGIVVLDGKEVARSQFLSRAAASQWAYKRAKALESMLSIDNEEIVIEGEQG